MESEKQKTLQKEIVNAETKRKRLEKQKTEVEKKRQEFLDIGSNMKAEAQSENKDPNQDLLKVLDWGFERFETDLAKINKDLGKLQPPKKIDEGSLWGMVDVEKVLDNTFWKDKPRLSLLITAGVQAQTQLQKMRPNTSHRGERDEYYAQIMGKDVEALFGSGFPALLGVIRH